MPVQFISLAQLKHGYAGSNFDLPLVSELMSATVMHFPAHDVWGKHKATGSCRAGASRPGFDPIFECSEFKVAHAEEKLVPKITANWGGVFQYMYVDIEPCHSGKYGKNEGGCKLMIYNTFANGKVFYTFDQDDYESGMNALMKRSDLQDQATYLRSLIGIYQ